MSAKYAAALSGHSIDLDDLRKWFTSDPIQVAEIEVPPDGKVTALLAQDFEGLSSGEQVQAEAWRLIGQINGVLFASDPDRSPVGVLGVYERTASGDWGRGAVYASFQGTASTRGRFFAEAIGSDGSPVPAPPPRERAWLSMASRGANAKRIADVLTALCGQPKWADLWNAFEIIDEDWRTRRNWNTGGVVWFRKTASLYRHSASHDHGKTARQWLQDNGKPEMELGDARRLIATLAAEWLDWQAAGASPSAPIAARW